MPLLSMIVEESQRKVPNRSTSRRGDSAISVTQISPCPYSTYLEFSGLDPNTTKEPDPEAKLRMKDGHWQERQIVEDLIFAGFEVKFVLDDQLRVDVGESRIPGHPDGLIVVYNQDDMLEIKAMDVWRWSRCKYYGIARAEPLIKCQVQSYMHSHQLRDMGINLTRIYTKHKDSCLPWDYEEPYDPGYITPIINMADKVMAGYVPQKEVSSLCSMCFHRSFCWETPILDFRGRDTEFDLGAEVQRWRKGKDMVARGELMINDARKVFIDRLGDLDSLMVQDLKVLRVKQNRTSIPVNAYMEMHGKEHLPQVLKETKFDQIKISDTAGK